MKENGILMIEEQEFLARILRRSINQRKAIYESYQKYLKKNREYKDNNTDNIQKEIGNREQ